MLIGRFQHNMDDKGRVFVPAKLREGLGVSFYATVGLDNCLFLYSIEEWNKQEEKICSLPMAESRKLQRFFFSNATLLEPDKQGRVLIPQYLRAYAKLEGEALILGVGRRAEIWNPSRWEAVEQEMTAEAAASEMEKLGF